MTLVRAFLFFVFVMTPLALLSAAVAGLPGLLGAYLLQCGALFILSLRIEEAWLFRVKARTGLPEALRAACARVLERRRLPGSFGPPPSAVRFAIFDSPALSILPIRAPGRPGILLLSRGALFLASAREIEERIDRALREIASPGRVSASVASYLVDRLVSGTSDFQWHEFYLSGPPRGFSEKPWGGDLRPLKPLTALRHAAVLPFLWFARLCFADRAVAPPDCPVSREFLGFPGGGGLDLLERRDR